MQHSRSTRYSGCHFSAGLLHFALFPRLLYSGRLGFVTAAGCFDNVAERWGIKMDAEVILYLVACIIVVMVVVDMVILLCFAFTRLEDQATKHPQDDPTTVTSR